MTPAFAKRTRLSRPSRVGIGKTPARNLRLMVDSEQRNTRASSRRVSTSGRASRRARAFVMNERYRLRAARHRVFWCFAAPPVPGRCGWNSARRPSTDSVEVRWLPELVVALHDAQPQPRTTVALGGRRVDEEAAGESGGRSGKRADGGAGHRSFRRGDRWRSRGRRQRLPNVAAARRRARRLTPRARVTCTGAPTNGTASAATLNATSPTSGAAGHHNRGRGPRSILSRSTVRRPAVREAGDRRPHRAAVRRRARGFEGAAGRCRTAVPRGGPGRGERRRRRRRQGSRTRPTYGPALTLAGGSAPEAGPPVPRRSRCPRAARAIKHLVQDVAVPRVTEPARRVDLSAKLFSVI